MPKIQRLSDQLANQIAAGEVIERPSSAAKELVENSLDAGAMRIAVEVADAGRTLRVTDDGEGMDPQDALLAFERFATSKVRAVDDLFALRTMGFRGEALASIAAVAKVEIRTRRRGADSGTLVRIEGGELCEQAPCGTAEGTTLQISDLFFNTPARLKFMKAAATEVAHVVEVVTALALANPGVAMTVLAGQRLALDTTGARDRAETASLVLGSEIGPRLLACEASGGAGTVEGLVAPPELIRGDRAKQWLFVNGRPVRHPALARAVDEAYAGHIPASRHPLYVMALTIDPEGVDFNVHPTKKEIRLRDSGALYSLIREAVGRALRQSASQRQLLWSPADGSGASLANAGSEERATPAQGVPFRGEPYQPGHAGILSADPPVSPRLPISAVQPSSAKLPLSAVPTSSVGLPTSGGPLGAERPFSQVVPQGAFPGVGGAGQGFFAPGQRLSEAELPSEDGGRDDFPWEHLAILGQLHETYIVLQHPDGLYMVDQHNSHERFLYEQLGSTRVPAQELLIPRVLDLPADSGAALEEHQGELGDLGFVVESLGDACWQLRATPAILPAEEAERTLLALLADAADGGSSSDRSLADRWRVTLACHSATKAGDRLTRDAMGKLLAQWRTCEQPFTCPHGRPTAFLISLGELHARCMRGMQTR